MVKPTKQIQKLVRVIEQKGKSEEYAPLGLKNE
jgi:hypothetical protein